MNWYLMLKGMEMGIVSIFLLVFTVADSLKYNGRLVSMPIRLVLICICIAILIHAAQAFK